MWSTKTIDKQNFGKFANILSYDTEIFEMPLYAINNIIDM